MIYYWHPVNLILQQILQQLERAGGRPGPDIDDAKKSLQDYTKLLKSGNKLDKEEQALTTKGMKQEGQRQSLTTKAMRTTTKAIGGTLSVAQALEAASTAMRDNRESFRSLNPSIEMTGSAIKMAGKVTGGLISATVGAIPLIGGLGQAAGTVVAALSEAAGEIVTAVGKTFTAELDRITGAFRTAAQTGALGADGMRGLGQQAVNAGLSFDSFAKTITKEGETLSFAFGTSAQAAKGLSDTTKAMRPFRSELLTLGIGVEQQNELTAKYIQFQQRQGRNEVQNTAALAQGSREYMKNLQELSKITGKSIEEQQAELAKKDAVYAQLLPQLEASLNGELENEPDWAALYESDPIGYVREKDVWEDKRKKLDAAKAENQRLQDEAMQKQQEQIQKFVEYGNQQLTEKIPHWSDAEKSQKEKAAITNYAIKDLGFTAQEINQVIDYRVLLGLRDGMLYRKQVAASKKKPTQKAASRVARPGTSNKPKTMTAVKKAQMKLAKSGKVQDAAKVFEQFI